ncbi:hypothetical protein [Desulfosporosinus sp. FKA]|uniref:hypothetical protein n=1 Tax=Desulfosporosinus sp. FKA TaxID=1969834 RepID=UPI000B49DB56|nr:hypothetical protein [Desulfosporosinus sp. FKA]
MFKIENTTIVYVACPTYNKTGGTELAHQLVYELKQQGVDARITYYDYNGGEKVINPAFRIYVDSFEELKNVIDSEKNIFITPEIKISLLAKYNHIQKCVWWMSVDNFVKNNGLRNAVNFYGLNKAVKLLINKRISLIEKKIVDHVVHFYQSEYARQFLLSHGVTKSYRLSDYINQSYLTDDDSDNAIEREGNVLYNPKKGIEFTNKLMVQSPNFNWIPIQNMTTDEVRELLRRSKVYIDFGNHPGKDRFPREAAISGCCVITGKRGSSAYYQDIPISDEFKFDDSDVNVKPIVEKIRECLMNYDEEFKKFEEYRHLIRGEYELFKKDVATIIK